MNDTVRDTDDVFGQSRLYLIYKLRLIFSWRSDGTIPLAIGRDLKALGFTLRDWEEATDFAAKQEVLSNLWNGFQDEDREEAFEYLEEYIDLYFDEAEANMLSCFDHDVEGAEALEDEFRGDICVPDIPKQGIMTLPGNRYLQK